MGNAHQSLRVGQVGSNSTIILAFMVVKKKDMRYIPLVFLAVESKTAGT